jgi:pyrimidine and pyridine-specific 5'-nucleotidase
MQTLIDDFFVRHLSLSQADANALHLQYYKNYGLAIEGLSRYHKIDPLEFNREVDDALPLDEILKPDAKLRSLLLSMDKRKVKLWLFTNAHITHGLRVVRLLGIEDLFEGITYCDYTAPRLLCKPHRGMYEKAERESGAGGSEDCYFVDDSGVNCKGAEERGWCGVHLVEPGLKEPEEKMGKHQIRGLEELRGLFPQFFKEEGKEMNGELRS